MLNARSNVDLKARAAAARRAGADSCAFRLPASGVLRSRARSHAPRASQDKWRNMHPSAESDAAAAKYPTPTKPKAAGAPKEKGARTGAAAAAAAAAAGAAGGGAGPDKKQYEKKLEDLVFEAVRTLKHSATLEGIAVHIEDKYDVPPGFRKQLAAHLKSLADAGKLTKAKTAFVLPGRGAQVTRLACLSVAPRARALPRAVRSRACTPAHAQPPKAGYDVKMAGYRNKAGGKVPEVRKLNCMRLLAAPSLIVLAFPRSLHAAHAALLARLAQFLINGKRLTAEEMAEEAARAVREAEEAAAAAEAAAQEAEQAEQEAMELERAAAVQGAR